MSRRADTARRWFERRRELRAERNRRRRKLDEQIFDLRSRIESTLRDKPSRWWNARQREQWSDRRDRLLAELRERLSAALRERAALGPVQPRR